MAAGVSDDQIRWRLKQGVLAPQQRGVYAYGHRTECSHCEGIEALLTRGPEAVICAHRAAGMYGFRPMCSGVDLLVPETQGGGHGDEIRIHRINDMSRAEPTFWNGVPIVSPAWALLEIAADLSYRAIEVALDESFTRGVVNRDEVRRVVEENPTRLGVPLLQELLTKRLVGNPTGSPGQEVLLQKIRAAKLPDPEMDAQIGGGFSGDMFWRAARLVAECDSWKFHSTRSAWARDRRKDVYCRQHGLALVRYTDEDLSGDPLLALIAKLAGMIVGRALTLVGPEQTTEQTTERGGSAESGGATTEPAASAG